MARNLEIKVACDAAALDQIRARATAMGAGPFSEMRQTDTYFSVATGRLKLRETETDDLGWRAELIAYRRADDAGSRWSDYQLVPLTAETTNAIKKALSVTCGVTVVVVKRRMAGVWRRTRIHLDTVDGLGCFVELETVVKSVDLDNDVRDEHRRAIEQLRLSEMPVISGSYGDLLGGRD